uniref:Reverse transcriptase RNase H-like domain-containing protein n=1 Tax=Aegilops tauschii subsp. strangulata TaxID=200361 RepID=A0A453IML0_AEGTS
MSKALSPRYQGLSTYEKEYLAVIVAVDQWRPYLQHAEFTILTDQRSLTHLTEQRLTTPWQQRAFTKLLGLQYTIKYKKGAENTAADALSRTNT